MTTDELLKIVRTRIAAESANPTGQSFLYELTVALEKLRDYEERDKTAET